MKYDKCRVSLGWHESQLENTGRRYKMEIETEFGKVSGSPAEVAVLFRELGTKKQVAPIPMPRIVPSPKVVKKKPKIIPFSKHRRNKPWTSEEDACLVNSVNAGRKHRLIGKDLGRTSKAVNMRICILKKAGTVFEFVSRR
jgi:hypothetical protein